jgi:hypothetical protein
MEAGKVNFWLAASPWEEEQTGEYRVGGAGEGAGEQRFVGTLLRDFMSF